MIIHYCTGIPKIKNDQSLSHPFKKTKDDPPGTPNHGMFLEIQKIASRPDTTLKHLKARLKKITKKIKMDQRRLIKFDDDTSSRNHSIALS